MNSAPPQRIAESSAAVAQQRSFISRCGGVDPHVQRGWRGMHAACTGAPPAGRVRRAGRRAAPAGRARPRARGPPAGPGNVAGRGRDVAPRANGSGTVNVADFVQVGRFAIAMDAATRAERQYMLKRMAFPFNTWNYAHNQNYLSYIQTQLGLAQSAISGARQLLAAPLDPKHNGPGRFRIHYQGQIALMRARLRFERAKD